MKKVIQYTELEIKRDTYIEKKLNIESYLYFEKKSNTLFTGKSIWYSQIKQVRSERFYKKGKLYR